MYNRWQNGKTAEDSFVLQIENKDIIYQINTDEINNQDFISVSYPLTIYLN